MKEAFPFRERIKEKEKEFSGESGAMEKNELRESNREERRNFW